MRVGGYSCGLAGVSVSLFSSLAAVSILPVYLSATGGLFVLVSIYPVFYA